jgi:hypothetical protein
MRVQTQTAGAWYVKKQEEEDIKKKGGRLLTLTRDGAH